jgi:hypothetical protein
MLWLPAGPPVELTENPQPTSNENIVRSTRLSDAERLLQGRIAGLNETISFSIQLASNFITQVPSVSGSDNPVIDREPERKSV